MHARVVFGQIRTQNETVVTQLYRDFVVPAARQQKGFKGIVYMVDPQSGDTLSISLWETEADMQAGESSDYYKEQTAKLASFDATRPNRVAYRVKVLEVPAGQ
jgi:heme-degrading monooxygenase HmoA